MTPKIKWLLVFSNNPETPQSTQFPLSLDNYLFLTFYILLKWTSLSPSPSLLNSSLIFPAASLDISGWLSNKYHKFRMSKIELFTYHWKYVYLQNSYHNDWQLNSPLFHRPNIYWISKLIFKNLGVPCQLKASRELPQG